MQKQVSSRTTSEIGKGTTFRLYLRPDKAVVASAADSNPEAVENLNGDRERILVVEDNERLRAVLVRQLVELGYQVSEADEAGAALAQLDDDADIDLLLTDIVMPGKLDGCGLEREFLARRPQGKVLLTSGFPGSRLADIDGSGTALRLLDKPYHKQDLAPGPARGPSRDLGFGGRLAGEQQHAVLGREKASR
jgi:CheY-like chemotaxis protein